VESNVANSCKTNFNSFYLLGAFHRHILVESPDEKLTGYEIGRPLEYYAEHFFGWKLCGPIAFRYKSIIAFTKRHLAGF